MEQLPSTLTPSLSAFTCVPGSSLVLSSHIAVPMSNTLYSLQLARRFCPTLVEFTGLCYSWFCQLLSRLKQYSILGHSAISPRRNIEPVHNSAGKCLLQQIHENCPLLPTLPKKSIKSFSFFFLLETFELLQPCMRST